MKQSMLTTTDNPFDPFDQYDEWYAYDLRQGYDSLGLLARIAVVSDEMSEADQSRSVEEAIDEIIRENVTGKHKKVTRDFEDPLAVLDTSES